MNELVYIYPTDTVWGIGGNIFSETVFEKIAESKGRDKDKPVSILFSCVDELFNYFDLPKTLTKDWLKEFFRMETTLLLPLSLCLKEIPPYITGGSEFVGIRCLEVDLIDSLIKEAGAPIITTSVNRSSEEPIIDYIKAKGFKDQYIPDAQLIRGEIDRLSGAPSTIIQYTDGQNFKVLREGVHQNEICRHMELLTT